jgi:cyclase
MRRSHTIRVLAWSRRPRFGIKQRAIFLASGLLTLALAALGTPRAPDDSEIPYTMTRLSSRVIVLDCQNVNVTAIAAKAGIVVIDTNRSPGAMRRLRRVIEEEFGRQDFIYVVNTHGDPDHSSGNGVFPSVPLVAHRGCAEYVHHARASKLRSEWNRRSRLEEARTRYGAVDHESGAADSLRAVISKLESTAADPQDLPAAGTPGITIEDSLHLDLGDLTLELRFCGEAHTNHDIVVYVPEEKLLLTGDLLCSPQSPCFPINAMADVPRLVSDLEGLMRREAGLETVVPGHGRIMTRADLATFCRTVSEQYAQIKTENSAARILGQAIERDGIQSALAQCPPPAPGTQRKLDWSEGEFGTLGVRLMRKGMVVEAVSVLRLAVRALPESSFLYGCLGDACLENDDNEAAVSAYRRSLALAPNNKYAGEMLKVLSDGK